MRKSRDKINTLASVLAFFGIILVFALLMDGLEEGSVEWGNQVVGRAYEGIKWAVLLFITFAGLHGWKEVPLKKTDATPHAGALAFFTGIGLITIEVLLGPF